MLTQCKRVHPDRPAATSIDLHDPATRRPIGARSSLHMSSGRSLVFIRLRRGLLAALSNYLCGSFDLRLTSVAIMTSPGVVPSIVRKVGPIRGRDKLALWWSRGSTKNGEWNIRMRAGYQITAPIIASQTWSAAFTGRCGNLEVDLLRQFISPGSVALDIGACIGFITVPLAMAAKSQDALVISYEPVPSNVRYLAANIRDNDLQDVVSVRAVGLGRTTGQFEIEVGNPQGGNASVLDNSAPRMWEGSSMVTCAVSTLDIDFPTGGKRCSAIKIDVEGYELEVLGGAARFVTENRPVILAELSAGWLRIRGIPENAPRNWCKDNDYKVFALWPHRKNSFSEIDRIIPIVQEVGWPRGDVLLVPDELVDSVSTG